MGCEDDTSATLCSVLPSTCSSLSRLRGACGDSFTKTIAILKLRSQYLCGHGINRAWPLVKLTRPRLQRRLDRFHDLQRIYGRLAPFSYLQSSTKAIVIYAYMDYRQATDEYVQGRHCPASPQNRRKPGLKHVYVTPAFWYAWSHIQQII